jgi:hypothetical protein
LPLLCALEDGVEDDVAWAAGAQSAADSATAPAHEAATRALRTRARDLVEERGGMDILSRAVGIRTSEVSDDPFRHLADGQASDVGTTDGREPGFGGAPRSAPSLAYCFPPETNGRSGALNGYRSSRNLGTFPA